MSNGSDGTEPPDGQRRVSNTYNEEFLADLMEQYPAAIQPSQAVRMAVQEAVTNDARNTMTQEIAQEMIDLMREVGGEWESEQSITIHSADVDIEEADVEVTEVADGSNDE